MQKTLVILNRGKIILMSQSKIKLLKSVNRHHLIEIKSINHLITVYFTSGSGELSGFISRLESENSGIYWNLIFFF